MEDIKMLQEELLVVLVRFHELCIQNDIRYSLHAGTLLGAVREKGFIPWDDDIDLTVTREQFEKLRVVLKTTDLGDEFAYDETSRYPRLLMKREGRPLVWADIFIYDYISQNKLARKIKMALLYFFVLFCRTKDEQKRSNRYGLHRGLKKLIMNMIMSFGNLFPLSFRHRLSHIAMQTFPGKRTHIHRSNDQQHAIKLTLPKEVMEEYQYIDFLGHELMISARWHDILQNAYGNDYMTPKKQKADEDHLPAYEEKRQYYINKYF